MPAMPLCPICLSPISGFPTVETHYDNLGKVCVMSGHDSPEWNERLTRQVCRGRCSGICEFCGQSRATELHHRKSRGVGGKWHPANCIYLCSPCHHWTTHHPQEAQGIGMIVKSEQDPAQIPVYAATGQILFLNDFVATKGRRGEF